MSTPRDLEDRIQDLERELGCGCCNTEYPPCGCCVCERHADHPSEDTPAELRERVLDRAVLDLLEETASLRKDLAEAREYVDTVFYRYDIDQVEEEVPPWELRNKMD